MKVQIWKGVEVGEIEGEVSNNQEDKDEKSERRNDREGIGRRRKWRVLQHRFHE